MAPFALCESRSSGVVARVCALYRIVVQHTWLKLVVDQTECLAKIDDLFQISGVLYAFFSQCLPGCAAARCHHQANCQLFVCGRSPGRIVFVIRSRVGGTAGAVALHQLGCWLHPTASEGYVAAHTASVDGLACCCARLRTPPTPLPAWRCWLHLTGGWVVAWRRRDRGAAAGRHGAAAPPEKRGGVSTPDAQPCC